MYLNKTFLAIIPARSGSKGLPNKNIMNLCGKPLIAWSIESALNSKYIDEVVVSTDSKLYADIAKSYGANVPFLRPKELSKDTTPTFDVIEHSINFYKNNLNKEFDYIVLLEPTSPLREDGDIDNAIEKLCEEKASSISSIGNIKEHPSILKKITNNRLVPFETSLPITTRRQDNETLFFPYGVVYIANKNVLIKEKTFYTSNCTFYKIKEHQCYEIDDELDFLCIEAIIKNSTLIKKRKLMNTLSFLIIGLGSMGKRRIRNLIALGFKNEMIAGFDLREDRREESKLKYKIKTFNNFEEAVNKYTPKIFIISTPPNLHMQYAEYAVNNNIHCFIEASVVEKEKILILSKRTKQNIFIIPSITMWYTHMVKEIKKIIDENKIGNILNINYQVGQYLPDWHPWENINDFYVSKRETGGAREIVPFELSWICKIFGKAKVISSAYKKLTKLDADIDDIYHCILELNKNIMLNLTIEVISKPVASRELTILGDNGKIIFNSKSNTLSYISSTTKDWIDIPLKSGTIESQYINPEEPYIDELSDFINVINKNDPNCFPNSLKDDYEILKLLEEIESKQTYGGG